MEAAVLQFQMTDVDGRHGGEVNGVTRVTRGCYPHFSSSSDRGSDIKNSLTLTLASRSPLLQVLVSGRV